MPDRIRVIQRSIAHTYVDACVHMHVCVCVITGAIIAGREVDELIGSATVCVCVYMCVFMCVCATAGAIIAGREVDELIGSATVQVRGDMAQRLLRGERCTLPVVLNDSGRGDDTQGTKDLMVGSLLGSLSKSHPLGLMYASAAHVYRGLKT